MTTNKQWLACFIVALATLGVAIAQSMNTIYPKPQLVTRVHLGYYNATKSHIQSMCTNFWLDSQEPGWLSCFDPASETNSVMVLNLARATNWASKGWHLWEENDGTNRFMFYSVSAKQTDVIHNMGRFAQFQQRFATNDFVDLMMITNVQSYFSDYWRIR